MADGNGKMRFEVTVAADRELGPELLRQKAAEVIAMLGGHPLADLSGIPKDANKRDAHDEAVDDVKVLAALVVKARLEAEIASFKADVAEAEEREARSKKRVKNLDREDTRRHHQGPSRPQGRPQHAAPAPDAKAELREGSRPMERPPRREAGPGFGNKIKGTEKLSAVQEPQVQAAGAA